MKKCTKCLIIKEFTDFNRRGEDKTRLKSHCKQCIGLKSKIYEQKRVRTYEEHRSYTLRKYWPGLSTQQASHNYKLLFTNQNGLCAVCKHPETAIDRQYGRVKQLAVDHDHTSGRVRGLLCTGCNTALGSLKENFDSTLNLAKYIQEYKGVL